MASSSLLNPLLDRPSPLSVVSSTLTSLLTSLTDHHIYSTSPHEIPIKLVSAILQLWDKLRELDERLDAQVDTEISELEELLAAHSDVEMDEAAREELKTLKRLLRDQEAKEKNRTKWVAWSIMIRARYLKNKLDHYIQILPLPSLNNPLPSIITSARTEFRTDLDLLFPKPSDHRLQAGRVDMAEDVVEGGNVVEAREREEKQMGEIRGLFLGGWEEMMQTGRYTDAHLLPSTPALPIISTNIQRHISPLLRRETILRKLNVGRGYGMEEEEVIDLGEVEREFQRELLAGAAAAGNGERDREREQEEEVDMDSAAVYQQRREEIRNGKRPVRKSLPARLAPAPVEGDVFTNGNGHQDLNRSLGARNGSGNGISSAKMLMNRTRPVDLEEEDIFSPAKRQINGNTQQPQPRNSRQSLPNLAPNARTHSLSIERHARFTSRQSSNVQATPAPAAAQARERSQTEASSSGTGRREKAREIMGSLGEGSAGWRRMREERMRSSISMGREPAEEEQMPVEQEQQQELEEDHPQDEGEGEVGAFAEGLNGEMDIDEPLPGQVEQSSAMEVDEEDRSQYVQEAAMAPVAQARRTRHSMPSSAAYNSQYQVPQSSNRQPSVRANQGRRVFSTNTTSQNPPPPSRRSQAPRRSLGPAPSAPAVATFQMPGMPAIEFPEGMLFRMNARGAFEPVAQMDRDMSPRWERGYVKQDEEEYGGETGEEYVQDEVDERSVLSEVALPPPASREAPRQFGHRRQDSGQSFLQQSGAPLPSTRGSLQNGHRLSVAPSNVTANRVNRASSSVLSPGSSIFGNGIFRVPQGHGHSRPQNASSITGPPSTGSAAQPKRAVRRHTELPPRPANGSSRAGSALAQARATVDQRRHQRQSMSAIAERPGGASSPIARQLGEEDDDMVEGMGFGGADDGLQMEDEPLSASRREPTPARPSTSRPAASRIPIPSPRQQPTPGPSHRPIKFVGNTHSRLGLPSGTAPSSHQPDPALLARQPSASPAPQLINTLKRHRPFKDDRVLRDPGAVKRSRVSGGTSGRPSLGSGRVELDLVSP